MPGRVSRLRESNLLSVGWSWLPGVFPPAYSFLCNIHCNERAGTCLFIVQEGQRVQTARAGNEFCSSTAVLSFTSASPAQEQCRCPQNIHYLSISTPAPPETHLILSASFCVHRFQSGYFSTSSASLLFPAKGKESKDAKERFYFFFKWRWREGYWNKPKQEPGMTNVERKAQNNQKLEAKLEHRFPHNAAPKKWEIKQEIKKCFIKAFSSLGNSLFFFFNFKWNLQHSKINKSFSRVTGVQNVSLHSSPTDLNWNSNLALAKVYNHLNSSAVNQKVLTASTQARVWRSPSMMQPSGMKYLYGDLVLAPHCQYQGKKFPLSTCAPSHLSGWGQMRPAGVKKLLQCTVR